MTDSHTDLLPKLELEPFLARYGEGRRRRNIEPVYREMLDLANQLADPKEIHREFGLGDLPELNEWLPSRSAAVALVVCTLGSALDAMEQALFPEEPHKAVVLNEISTVLVTGLTRIVRNVIHAEVTGRGLKAGPAYRPGVGRWPLELQSVVFDRLPAHEIGVELDEYMLMIPLKSNSLVIPLLNHKEKSGVTE